MTVTDRKVGASVSSELEHCLELDLRWEPGMEVEISSVASGPIRDGILEK